MSENAWKGLITNFIIVFMLLSLAVVSITGYSVIETASGSTTTKLQPIYRGNETRPEISLMFNVYWGEEYLLDIAEIFKSYNMRATFFIGGCWAAKNPDLIKKLDEMGFEIANHGYTHKNHKELSVSENHKEIIVTDKLLTSILGKLPSKLFAPPSGYIGDNMLQVCQDEGFKVVMWSRDTIDWRDKDSKTVYARAVKNMKNGDLILMHPSAHTLEALPKVLAYCKTNGYTAVTVSDILK